MNFLCKPVRGRCPVRAALMFVTVLLSLTGATHAADVAEADVRDVSRATAGLDIAEGLEATLFAGEPMLLSPTNIDVDAWGRVWVCEVVNYRRRNGERKEGDRILVLEDTDGDGAADKQTVFYQGRDIDSAMGVCVLGDRVIVSVAPNVFVFRDTDGDLKADEKEVLFSETGQPQHDHSNHAFVFGPDGKLYWNFGNTGGKVNDARGQPVVDKAGNVVVDNGKPYFGGMVFRCNPDGSDFEVLAHNFRNNYEVAVDSFGTLWQSDNDDDGNRSVRINFVMEYGNYGYRDQMTGAGWRSDRVGMHEDIPLRHWHLRDPGVVPNLLQTGAGSPTGICVYEGGLLPERFRDEIIHCDAGPNIVRAYPTERDGAGYTATIENIAFGARDNWFRPSDVCVAPDGSIFVADWYDPGVGGHRMGDVDKGRIFRIAPPGTPYEVEPPQVDHAAGAIAALQSPNQATRYLGWTALHDMGSDAKPALEDMLTNDNPRFQARALWLLGAIEGNEQATIERAYEFDNPDLRIVGIRQARRLVTGLEENLAAVVDDPSPQVRREVAVALREVDEPWAVALWVSLAQQYDGDDRWYLEALGLAADNKWDACLTAYLAAVGDDWKSNAGRDIVWRSRSQQTPGLLAELLLDPNSPSGTAERMLRAFDFQTARVKSDVLVELTLDGGLDEHPRGDFIRAQLLERIGGFRLDDHPEFKVVVQRVLAATQGTEQFVRFVRKFKVANRGAELLELAQNRPETPEGIEAIRLLLKTDGKQPILDALSADKPETVAATAAVLGTSGDPGSLEILGNILNDTDAPTALRRESVRALGRSKNGVTRLVEYAGRDDVSPELTQALAAVLHAAESSEAKKIAQEMFPLPPSKNSEKVPPIEKLVDRNGNVSAGQAVFETTGTCAKCHMVGNKGKEVGPSLTEIGSKLSRRALYESILFPSAGISHNYESYIALLTSGEVVTGIKISETDESITLKGADAIPREIARDDIEELVKQEVSLMPADLQKALSVDDLVNVVSYLESLKKQSE